MSLESIRALYKEKVNSYDKAISRRSKIIGYIALLRLLVLVACVYLIVTGIKTDQVVFFFASFLMAVTFFTLVGYYKLNSDKRELFRQLKRLNETELGCLDHHYEKNPPGDVYADRSHPWTFDLDIFGKGSLYQYVNRTATLKGNQILAELLSSIPGDTKDIYERQEIIRELKNMLDFRQNYSARANLIDESEDDLKDIEKWLEKPGYIQFNRWLIWVATAISLVSVSIIIAGIINFSNFGYFLPLLFVNWTLLSPFINRTNQYQRNISRKHRVLEGYSSLLRLIGNTPLHNSALLVCQDHALEGKDEVRKLSRLLNLFDQRLNLLMGVLLNSLFLFDYHMIFWIERWKIRNHDKIISWIELTGRMEAIVSLAGYAYNHPEFVFPEISVEHTGISADSLGHPLIPGNKRVDNDLTIEKQKAVIITGANMAGKSTFLRSIGINTVLGYAGCPVCATRYRSGFLRLFSSMRTSDSLKDEESYFLAEIKRISEIFTIMKEGEPMLVLLDELLKGTNTTDKQRGSIGIIKKTLDFNMLSFIATHDLSLGELADSHKDLVVNYCFESHINGLEITFDYKIEKGIAKNMNASVLMKKMGIVD